MGDCCNTPTDGACSTPAQKVSAPKKTQCPACGTTAHLVERKTLLQQLKKPQHVMPPEEHFYFCAETTCAVVYFSPSDTIYVQEDIRKKVGQKTKSPDRTVCYCFDVTAEMVEQELAATGTSASKAFVMEQVKEKTCSCDVQNPSGRCCLPDFPKEKKRS